MGAYIEVAGQGAYASTLSKHFDRVLELFADAIIHPNFTEEELEKERQKWITNIKAEETASKLFLACSESSGLWSQPPERTIHDRRDLE